MKWQNYKITFNDMINIEYTDQIIFESKKGSFMVQMNMHKLKKGFFKKFQSLAINFELQRFITKLPFLHGDNVYKECGNSL